MSAASLEEIRQKAASAAIEICWRQWGALGAPAATTRPAGASILDPEALLLLSLAMKPHERRLVDMAGWWARVGSQYSSVARLRAFVDRFPPEVKGRVGGFAALAEAAGDHRWKQLAAGHSVEPVRRKGRDKPHLRSDAALMLRVRAAFGLGIKSDLLTVLIGMRGEPATVQTLVHATGYSEPPLRTAARDMTAARLIHQTNARPIRLYTDARPRLLFADAPTGDRRSAAAADGSTGEHMAARAAGVDEPTGPPWVFWMDLCSFLSHTIHVVEGAIEAGATRYVASSRFRDLDEQHRAAFEHNRIRVPLAADHPGEAFLDAFRDTLDATSAWVSDKL